MAATSSLFCGYTEGAFSRVTSFNWYEDNNYKAFLGINSTRGEGKYNYDHTASEYRTVHRLQTDEEEKRRRECSCVSHNSISLSAPFCNDPHEGFGVQSGHKDCVEFSQAFPDGKILYAPDSPAVRQIIKNVREKALLWLHAHLEQQQMSVLMQQLISLRPVR